MAKAKRAKSTTTKFLAHGGSVWRKVGDLVKRGQKTAKKASRRRRRRR